MIDLSVVIPYFNAKNTIMEAVNSVKKLRDLDVEIIIVNDGSDSVHLPILNRLERENGNVSVLHKFNGGVSSARNFGINNALGNYIYFLDADDSLMEIFDDKTILKLKQNNNNIIVGNREKKYIYSNKVKNYYDYEDGVMETEKFIEYSLSKSIIYWNLGGYIVNRNFLNKYSIRFNENYQSAEDLEFFSNILENSKSVSTSECVFFRYNFGYEKSASMTITQKKIKDQILVYENLIKKYKKNKNISKFFSTSLLRVFNEIETLESKQQKIIYEEIDFKLQKISNYKFKYCIIYVIMKIFGIRKGNYYIYKLKGVIKGDR